MEHLHRTVADENIDCDLQPRGYLQLAETRAQAARLQDAQRALASISAREGDVLAGSALAAEAGTARYRAGLLVHNASSVQPARYLAGLARAALRAGADVHVRTPAARLSAEDGGVSVTTARGTVRARDALIATNGYSGGVVPWVRRRVIPIEGFIVATEPLAPDVLAAVSPRRHLAVETKNFLCYWRTTADNRLIFGGRASFAPTTPEQTAAALAARMRSRFPALGDVRIDAAWGGNVAFTFDRLPHVTRRGRVMTAVGCSGGGVALTGYMGSRAAAWLTGDEPPVFARLPFRTALLYGGRPWFLRPAGVWFKLQDRLG